MGGGRGKAVPSLPSSLPPPALEPGPLASHPRAWPSRCKHIARQLEVGVKPPAPTDTPPLSQLSAPPPPASTDAPSPSTPPRATDLASFSSSSSSSQLLDLAAARDAAAADAASARAALTALEAAVLEPTFKPPSAWAEREVAHRADRAAWAAEAAVASARISDLEATVAFLRSGDAVSAALARADAADAAATAARADAEACKRALHELRLAVTAGDSATVRAAVLARGGGSLHLDGVPLSPGVVATRVADLDGRGVGVEERASPRAAAGARGASARLMGARSIDGWTLDGASDAGWDVRTGPAVAALAGEFEKPPPQRTDSPRAPRRVPPPSTVPPTPSPAKAGGRVVDDLTPCKLEFGEEEAGGVSAQADEPALPSPQPSASTPASPSTAATTIATLEARLAMDEAQLHRLAAALEAADADRAALEAALAAAGVPRPPPPTGGGTTAALLSARAATEGRRRRRRRGKQNGGDAEAPASASESDDASSSITTTLRSDLAAATARADALAARLAAAAAAVAAGRVPALSELSVAVAEAPPSTPEIQPADTPPLPVSTVAPGRTPPSPSHLPPPLTEDELEAVRLRGERDALMDALVSTKLELAERQGDVVRARRALARAAAMRASSEAALDGLKATLTVANGGVGVAPAVAAALARAGGVLARAGAVLSAE